MAAENKGTNSELIAAGLEPETGTQTTKQDASTLPDGADRNVTVPVTASVGDPISANGSNVVSSQGNHHCQGSQSDNNSYPDNNSYAYYAPGYNPYVTGPYMGYDGQAYYAPSYGPEACYTWDSTYAQNLPEGSGSKSENQMGPWAPGNSNISAHVKTNANGAVRLPLNTHALAFEPQNKGKQAAGPFPRVAIPKQSCVPYNGYMNENSNGSFWVNRDRYRKPDRKEGSNAAVELTVGPRTYAKTPSESAKQDSQLGLALRRDMFNLPDFQTEYEDAKFYVIKSYSEDDVHKSLKYSVWSSTPNGNKKLDAAFREAEAKSREDGKKHPVFLFFSVNASRQFVGLAEMVGYVDFNKDLDFWQVDKWLGFFPVQWHIIKDIPNRELRHIILDNNDDKPVTHTRDTHEIKLREGLQMLAIFKNYSAGTSLLDDMDFYEEREKALKAKKANKPATIRMDFYKDSDFDYEIEDSRRGNADKETDWSRRSSDATAASLVDLTKNLSIRGRSTSKNYVVKNASETT